MGRTSRNDHLQHALEKPEKSCKLIEMVIAFSHTSAWFDDDDSQLDFVILHMPTIILPYTASLLYRMMSIDSVSGDGVDKPSAMNRILYQRNCRPGIT